MPTAFSIEPFSEQIYYGDFVTAIPASEEYLKLHFSPDASRKRRWSNYGLSADFLGDYFAAFFPGTADQESSSHLISQRETVKSAVSYIANELLENAVKYSDEQAALPISIGLFLYEREIIFDVINYSNRTIADSYRQFIEKLLQHDIEEIYMEHLERAAAGDSGSHMGVLTMIHDYSARFGWQFRTLNTHRDIIEVEVIAQLTVAN